MPSPANVWWVWFGWGGAGLGSYYSHCVRRVRVSDEWANRRFGEEEPEPEPEEIVDKPAHDKPEELEPEDSVACGGPQRCPLHLQITPGFP